MRRRGSSASVLPALAIGPGAARAGGPAGAAKFELPANPEAAEALYPLNEGALRKIEENGFAVLSRHQAAYLSEEHFKLFDRHDLSVFITSGAALHLLHTAFDDRLAKAEREHLRGQVAALALPAVGPGRGGGPPVGPGPPLAGE